MPEIRLVKRYPHIKDEDVTSIFQEGYVKGFENGRKGAIPIEWMYLWRIRNMDKCPVNLMPFDVMLEDWEQENANNN